MPFKSKKQRKFMFAKHPKIAKRWAQAYGAAVKPKRRIVKRKRRVVRRKR